VTSSWSVLFELPRNPEKGRDWGTNKSATVVCDTAERAAEIIREAHSDAVVYAINHKGKEVTYVDPACLSRLHFAKPGEKCPLNRRHPYTHVANDQGRCATCAALIVVKVEPDPRYHVPEGGYGNALCTCTISHGDRDDCPAFRDRRSATPQEAEPK
jgi:hypothetical protein